jgi:hypothetical protein
MPTLEQIELLKKDGRWPLPVGMTISETRESNPKAVKEMLTDLARGVSPRAKQIVEKAIANIQ